MMNGKKYIWKAYVKIFILKLNRNIKSEDQFKKIPDGSNFMTDDHLSGFYIQTIL